MNMYFFNASLEFCMLAKIYKTKLEKNDIRCKIIVNICPLQKSTEQLILTQVIDDFGKHVSYSIFSAKCLQFCLVGNQLMVFFRLCPWIRKRKSYQGCGFEVIDPTVAWTSSRVGPSIRRGQRFCIFLYDCIRVYSKPSWCCQPTILCSLSYAVHE